MGKKISCKTFLVLTLTALFSVNEFPQETEKDQADSSAQTQLNKLNTGSFDDLVLFLYLNKNNDTGLSYYVHKTKNFPLSINKISDSGLLSFNSGRRIEKRINDEFNLYLKFRNSFILKTDLGETGKLLNRLKKAAAFILLILHLNKYQTKLY